MVPVKRKSDDCRLFHICGAATANDLSPRRVLVRCTANVNVSDDRSRRLASEMSWQSPGKYRGVWPCSVLYMNVASLKSTRRRTGSQCSSLRTGVMCSRRLVRVISLAAAFCADCRRWNRLCCIVLHYTSQSSSLPSHQSHWHAWGNNSGHHYPRVRWIITPDILPSVSRRRALTRWTSCEQASALVCVKEGRHL